MEKTVESKELLQKVSPLKEELKLKEEKLIGLENKFEVLEKELKDLRQDYKNAGTKEKEAAIQTWIEQQNKLINDNIEERKELRQEINKIQDKLGEIETKVLVGNEIERLKKENEELKKRKQIKDNLFQIMEQQQKPKSIGGGPPSKSFSFFSLLLETFGSIWDQKSFPQIQNHSSQPNSMQQNQDQSLQQLKSKDILRSTHGSSPSMLSSWKSYSLSKQEKNSDVLLTSLKRRNEHMIIN